MIHIHARTPDGVPSYEIEDFRAITEAIRAEVDDVIINYSTGAIGVPIEKRIEYLRELRPDVAALNMSSMNYAKYSKRAQGLRVQGGVRELVRHDHRVPHRDERARDQGRARVLRHRATSPTSTRCSTWGSSREPLQISCVMGVTGGIRPNAAQPRPHGRAGARRARGPATTGA